MTIQGGQITPVAGSGEFTVDVLDTFAAFEAMRPAWERLQQKDPDTTVFLSWEWLAQAFRMNPYRWSVLIARPTSSPDEIACILPLKYRVHWSDSHNEFHSELEAGGRLLWSEYTGFICDPQFEDAALAAVAFELTQMPWSRLSMRYVAQEKRARVFTAALEQAGLPVSWKDYKINDGETNNLICPATRLPEDFDSYLKTQVSSNTRQQYNRFRRRNLDNGDLHFTHATPDTFDQHLGVLMEFWRQKWADSKRPRQLKITAQSYVQVLTAALHTGNLFLPVLWQGERPLGALGHVLDPQIGTSHFVIAGRDTDAKEPFIGSALHFHSIEWAINEGYLCYDFCHGNEPYKYSYGVSETEVLYFSVRRKDYQPDLVFDSIGTGEALRRATTMIEKGETEKAVSACKQLSGLLS